MSKENQDLSNNEDLPEVAVERRRGLSIIWLIPVVAALIGGWLTYQTISEKGPRITIVFNTAEGLEAGKTKIKYKSVDVGEVEEIAFSDDLKGVIVTAALVKDAKPHLNENTRFWVVRPRIGAHGISGLNTLVSGAYIEVEPGSGNPRRKFQGLDRPPILRADAPGRKFVLAADKLGSLSPGSPIYFRGLEVGEILGHELTADQKNVHIHIYVKAPHHELVRKHTRFWNVSGINVSMDADGMQVNMTSLEAMLSGGIAFDIADRDGAPSKAGTVFPLFDSYDSMADSAYSEKIFYVAFFDGSVRGLSKGAPVEVQGIKVGSVTDIDIEIDDNTLDIRVPVTFQLEPERVPYINGDSDSDPREMVSALIQRGLRAQLQVGSLLTGQIYVDLIFRPDLPVKQAGLQTRYPEFPVVPSTMDEFRHSAAHFLAQIRNLPLQEIGENLLGTLQGTNRIINSSDMSAAIHAASESLQSLDRLVDNVDGQVIPTATSIRDTAAAASRTLAQAQSALTVLEEGSPVRTDLANTLEEAASAARSLRLLADFLERKPDALIYGKRGNRR